MNPKPCGFNQRHSLKLKAEAMVSSLSPKHLTAKPAEILLHELLVHKIELEIQNEESQRLFAELVKVRDRYIDLYEFAPVGYITLNREGLIKEINLTGSALLGADRPKLLNRRFTKFVAAQERDRWYRLFLSMLEHGKNENQTFDLEMARANKSLFYARLDCLARESLDAPPVLRIALSDINKIKLAEKQLRIAATAFKSTNFESQEGIFITDANKVILKVNPAFTKITGYSSEEAIGQTSQLLESEFHDPEFYAAIWQALNNTGAWLGEIWNRRKNGDIYPVRLTITSAQDDDDGCVLYYVATLTDISQQKAASEQIEQLEFYDQLTNLPNRRLLKDKLHLAFAASTHNKRHGALLFIDLDNFKNLNDTLGHNTGDLLLHQVAHRLLISIGDSDTAARLGGDDFVVMLENLDEKPEQAAIQAELVGKNIQNMLNKPYVLADLDYHCTASIGITLFYDHVVSVDELLRHADIAMYQAKQRGRNNVCFFDPSMQSVITGRAALEGDLHLAVEKSQLKLYYQIQTSWDGLAVGAEVLMRWQHPQLGLIAPMAFIPLAEEIGLISAIGQWELEAVCTQLKNWESHAHSQDLRLAVNISAYQFYQPDFVTQVSTILKKTAIQANRLKLELTETTVLKDIDDAITKMQQLKNIGVCFSLDDFGTGYSSLSYLTQLPFDQLKIDQSFIRNIGIQHADSVVVQSIINMTNDLGIEVIAEGVETEAQRSFLTKHGCPLFQGYLFGEPLPLHEFELLLNKNRC
ncbi:MAG: EAL domain-containing protein [Methylococcales bacterium]